MASRLLCAIDGEPTHALVRTAGELASGLGSAVVLAHAVGVPSLFRAVRSARERTRHRALTHGREKLQRARRQLPERVAVRQRVEFGAAVDSLLEIAREEDAELIVVGSRGRGALLSALLGSVSRDLARAAPCPLVVVSPRAVRFDDALPGGRGGPRRSLVCAIDGSERSVQAARLAADMAARLGDRLLLVHAWDAARGEPWGTEDAGCPGPDVVKDALDAIDGQAEGVLVPGPAPYALEALANRERARLIVVAPRRTRHPRSALLGSFSTMFVGVAGCPVVLLPEAAKLDPGTGHYEIRHAA